MLDNNQKIIGSIGVIVGLGYSIKTQKPFFLSAIITIGIGFAGLYIGKQISNLNN